MASKSVFTGPAPGDRFARRLILDINRNAEFFTNDRDAAIAANDPVLIQQVNQTRISIEQTANELRRMENIPEQLAGRVRDTLTRADTLLSNYEPYSPRFTLMNLGETEPRTRRETPLLHPVKMLRLSSIQDAKPRINQPHTYPRFLSPIVATTPMVLRQNFLKHETMSQAQAPEGVTQSPLPLHTI